MPTSVTMPRLGESVTEGTVTRWLKAEGEHVDADEPLLEVSTDKVDTEVPSPASGTLLSIKVQEDETVEIGVELAVIGEGGGDGGDGGGGAASSATAAEQLEPEPEPEAQPEPEPEAQPEPGPEPEPQPEPEPEPQGEAEPKAETKPRPAPAPTPAPNAGGAAQRAAAPDPEPAAAPDGGASDSAPSTDSVPSGDVEEEVAGAYVTPLVRKLAAEHGIDLSAIEGTGVGGRIRKSDVLAAAEKAAEPAPAAPSAPAASAPPQAAGAAAAQRGKVEKMSRMRQVIATRMVESLQTSAQLTTVVEVDVTKIARLRQAAKAQFEAREGVKLSFLPFFAVAAIEALKAHPVVNSSVDLDAKTVTYHDAEHLGIAVDTDRGLLVPVIHDAGDLNLAGIARKIADLAERTRGNKVSPDELGGGTFTLTNTGSRGALFDTPIINQPQVGILGTGAVVKRPVVVSSPELGETIAIRSMVYLALSYDHRIVDGADAARFLVTMKERLEAGAFERALGVS